MTDLNLSIVLAVTVTGLAAFLATTTLLWIVLLPPPPPLRPDSTFDADRRTTLRKNSLWYRLAEGWIERFARRQQNAASEARLKDLARDLKTAGIVLPWLPEEHVASVQVQAIALGAAGFALGWLISGEPLLGVIVGVAVGGLMHLILAGDLERRGAARRKQLKERLPFAVDLMALMLEAGATFPECLAVAVAENQNHPLGQELGAVLRETNLGRTRREALLELQQRVLDDDVREFVFAVVTGEELGTPMSQILRMQADQMRLKRGQYQEKESAEAQVSIVFPGMVIMLACLLIAVTPFLLQALESGAVAFFGSP